MWASLLRVNLLLVYPSVPAGPPEAGRQQADRAQEEGPGRQVHHLPEQSGHALPSIHGLVRDG